MYGMKTLNNRLLSVLISIFAIACASLSAQPVRETVQDELPAFSRIELGGDFALDISYGKQYSARMNIEELYAEYVQFAVEDSTLTVSMDERRVPAEIRKLFRGREDGVPNFRIIVTMPETLRSLQLGGRSILVSADDLVVNPEAFSLRATDNARVASFAFGSGRVELQLDKKAEVNISVTCDSLFVRQAGTSSLELNHHTVATAIDLSASCSLVVKGETELLKLDSRGFAKSILNGEAPVVRYKLANSSQVNATTLTASRAIVEMSGLGMLTQGASEELTVDLSGGSTVYFLNDPTIRVLYLKNASLIPYDRK